MKRQDFAEGKPVEHPRKSQDIEKKSALKEAFKEPTEEQWRDVDDDMGGYTEGPTPGLPNVTNPVLGRVSEPIEPEDGPVSERIRDRQRARNSYPRINKDGDQYYCSECDYEVALHRTCECGQMSERRNAILNITKSIVNKFDSRMLPSKYRKSNKWIFEKVMEYEVDRSGLEEWLKDHGYGYDFSGPANAITGRDTTNQLISGIFSSMMDDYESNRSYFRQISDDFAIAEVGWDDFFRSVACIMGPVISYMLITGDRPPRPSALRVFATVVPAALLVIGSSVYFPWGPFGEILDVFFKSPASYYNKHPTIGWAIVTIILAIATIILAIALGFMTL